MSISESHVFSPTTTYEYKAEALQPAWVTARTDHSIVNAVVEHKGVCGMSVRFDMQVLPFQPHAFTYMNCVLYVFCTYTENK